MLTSLYAGVSGIKNLQKKLDVLGNNIANINTIGYKRSRITFADSFNQISKSGKLGTGLTKTQTLFNQGMLEATGNITDLAIQGNSFFVLNDGGNQVYSRDEVAVFDANRNLVNNTGMNVKGWMADNLGQITVSETLENIQIDTNMTSSPIATQNLRLSGNLSTANTATSSVWDLGEPLELSSNASVTILDENTNLADIEQFSSDFANGSITLDLTGSNFQIIVSFGLLLDKMSYLYQFEYFLKFQKL
jgi:flagellar hook-basal body protein